MVSAKEIDIAGFADDSITDGPGLRFTLFTQGCPHHCEGCHNPETHCFGSGTPYTPEALFERIRRNPLVRGVTFSGGEPFAQSAGLTVLAKMLKEAGYEVAVYSGYTFEELLTLPDPAVKTLLENADVLIDGPFLLGERSLDLHFRGSANQRVLNVHASLQSGAPVPMTDRRWI